MYHYIPDYLAGKNADELLFWLEENVCWKQEKYRMFGQDRTAPRLVAWYGDPGLIYRYSSVTHEATGWPEILADVCEGVRKTFSLDSNFVLINRYRDGADSMGWHRDDEAELRGPVASVSLGATRSFLMRERAKAKTHRIDLEHGSLILLDSDVLHTLPKTKRNLEVRINLTFRHVVCV